MSKSIGDILAIVSFCMIIIGVVGFLGLFYTGTITIDTDNTGSEYSINNNGDNASYNTSSQDTSDTETEELNRTSVELRIHHYLNEARSERGISNVSYNENMAVVSQYKSDHMVDNRYFAHVSPDGMGLTELFERFNYEDCNGIGENLAKTYYETPVDTNYGGVETYTTEEDVAKGVVKQFIASPSHKENLLDDEWDTESIGFRLDGEDVIVTQHLCSSW